MRRRRAKRRLFSRRHHRHNMMLVKLTIGVGLVLLMVLPKEHQWWATLALNQLWLWKT